MKKIKAIWLLIRAKRWAIYTSDGESWHTRNGEFLYVDGQRLKETIQESMDECDADTMLEQVKEMVK